MKTVIIKVRTITVAQHAVSVLKSQGIHCEAIKTEKINKNDGCGWAIKIFEEDEENVLKILKSFSIKISGVEKNDLLWQRRYHLP